MEQIVTAAIAVADAEGLAAVSIRRVATELGVAPMSLYRHIVDKDDLLIRMMDQAFGELDIPSSPRGSWREQLERAARMVWELFRTHAWLAPAMSMTRPQPLASAIPLCEWMLSALAAAGMELREAFTAYLTLFNYLRGIAVAAEAEQDAVAETGMDSEQWIETQDHVLASLTAGGRFPRFAELVGSGYDVDLDGLFEYGLQRLLDGMAVQVEHQSPA
ncbi:MAG TPA: TetR/AcrR family transcriptional regulator C-terminal domain-containing protein [Actinopolymorphaceae bacterium]